MNRTQRNMGLLLAVAYAVIIVIFSFTCLATRPWHCIPELGGDGMKNSFVYIYHSVYGKGYWFGGMNYPYGEHIVYTDGMPFLSVIMAALPGITPGIAMTVLLWLLGLSYVVAIVYVYKILVHYKVNVFMAVLFAGLIVMMSPQFFRLRSHYGLAFACVIPMMFYWTIQYLDTSRIKYCIYLFILGTISTFMHPYHAGLVMMWTACYTVGLLFSYRATLKEKMKHLVPLYIAVAACLLLVALVMKVTDPLKDRPAVPYYTSEYYTHLKQLLISGYSPAWQFAETHKLINSADVGGEGVAYAGLVCLVTLGLVTLLVVLRKTRVEKNDKTPLVTGFPLIWLITGLCILLLGMGGPMLISMKAINYLSFFKQFRSLGRFSMVYYYIVTIFAVVAINYARAALIAKGKRAFAYALLLITFGFWAFEASGYIKYARAFTHTGVYNYDMVYSANEKKWPQFLKEHNYTGDSFQAAVILPYFHMGTDKLWVHDPGWETTLCAKACLQLHLPMTDVLMSRSSWSLAEKQVKIAGGPLVPKEMLRDLKSDKPILVLYFPEAPATPEELYLLKTCNYLGEMPQCKVYAAYPQRLLAHDKRITDSMLALAATLPEGDTCVSCTGPHYIDHFDKYTAQHLFGAGAAAYGTLKEDHVATIALSSAPDSQLYECSAWFLLSTKDYRSPDIVVQLQDSAKNVIDTKTIGTLHSVDNHGLWFRTSDYFKLPPACRYVNCMIAHTDELTYLAMDEFQLRPASGTIISKTGGKVMVNNHLLKE